MTTKSGPQQSPVPPRSGIVHSVLLVGFMGSGKTSVGEALGRRLGWRFEDLDDRIEAREGRTIAEIFREMGETVFRQKEREALVELLGELDSSQTVAALGGGAFVQPENFRLLKNCGVPTIFLDAPIEELWRRCQAEDNQRPLGQSFEHFRNLYESRRESYKKAGLYVNTGGSEIEAVAGEIAKMLCLEQPGEEK